MGRNRSIRVTIKNSTSGQLTVNSAEALSRNVWQTNAQAIPNNQSALAFHINNSGNNSYIRGQVAYNSTSASIFTIRFHIPRQNNNQRNSYGMFCMDPGGGNSCAMYNFQEMDSTFTKPITRVSRAEHLNLYYHIGPLYLNTIVDSNKFTAEQYSMITSLSTQFVTTVSKDLIIQESCERYDEEKIKHLFQERTSASIQDILSVNSVPDIDKIYIILTTGLLSAKDAVLFSVNFAQFIASDLEYSDLKLSARDYLTELKAVITGQNSEVMGDLYTKMTNISTEKANELTNHEHAIIDVCCSLVDMSPKDSPLNTFYYLDVLAKGNKAQKQEMIACMFSCLNKMTKT